MLVSPPPPLPFIYFEVLISNVMVSGRQVLWEEIKFSETWALMMGLVPS